MKNKWCTRCLVVLVMVFGIIIHVEDVQYRKMLKNCDELEKVIDKQREDNDKIVSEWENSYDKLQNDYGSLIVENDKLKKKVAKLKEQLNEQKLKEYSLTLADIELIVKVCKCEAGEKNYVAQRGVCAVILNRVKSGKFPDSVTSVVYQKKGNIPQFSVAYNGMLDKCSVDNDSLANVYRVIVSGSSLPDYVLYFYDENIDYQNWVLSLNRYDVIEGTVFAYQKGD